MHNRLICDEFSHHICAERDNITVSFRREQLQDGIRDSDALTEEEHNDNNDAELIQENTVTLTCLLPALTTELWASEDKNTYEKIVDQGNASNK